MVFFESFNPEKDIPDLTGKVIIVTGGNAGIGFTAVKHLAKRGAKVYLGARSDDKAKAAIERLTAEGIGSGEVHYLNLDLSDPKLAKAAAEDFLAKETRLDVLVNNAAQTLIPYKKTLYDIQDVVLVNYFGTVTFTLGLLPLLEKTAKESGTDVRIVNVITTGIKLVPAGKRFRNREDFNEEYAKSYFPKLTRYTSSKLAVTIWTRELQRRLDEKEIPIIVIASDPGGVHTDGNKNYARQQNAIVSRLYIAVSYLFFRSAEKGSYGSVFAAASPKVREDAKAYRGAYLNPDRKNLKAPNPQVYDQDLAKELWQTTKTLLTEIGVWQDVI
ncbi:NAD-P-binding protein [Irpex rosettiformis]|uniref:NAD-P-binding protein n=1 Tax=Irpex rosettiformis TaxID=378272 RepID=A0ACB8UAL3_9APHY|nr:NAD-P-binding protein [Irpex rosettiformis]